jgi:hypothetical protein
MTIFITPRNARAALVAAGLAAAFALPTAAEASSTDPRECGTVENPSPYDISASWKDGCPAARRVLPKAIEGLQVGEPRATVRYRGQKWKCFSGKYLMRCTHKTRVLWAEDQQSY